MPSTQKMWKCWVVLRKKGLYKSGSVGVVIVIFVYFRNRADCNTVKRSKNVGREKTRDQISNVWQLLICCSYSQVITGSYKTVFYINSQ